MIIPTPVKDIDKILRVIHNDAEKGIISRKMIQLNSGISNDEETEIYLNELVSSGYIKDNPNGSYSILYQGVDFYNQGGYEGERIRNNTIEQQRMEINSLQKRLSEAQLKDIPINAEDRKTVTQWTVAQGVIIIVSFLLGLFAGWQWL